MTLAEQVGSLRRAIHRVINRRLSGRTRRPFQHLIAMKCIAHGEVRSQVDLADRLGIDAPAVSRLVDRLVEDGLVTRQAGENRRCVKLQTTESVGPELELLGEAARAVDEEVSRHLTEAELHELRRLLDKALGALTQGPSAQERPLDEAG
ncbi:MarR family winged helix-turn-helix transcriptional regulator [[Archangium] primigenium]|uniref:MarR family winged helix-turn-helix transcriptional regulator n=1 Tax=Melittangium TaxID=44 RepID=UPI0019594BB0|nr:MarR family transcriptional regulator [Archangium primigenium]MBM7117089.1 MarR family transcriptional regulator [Archangium primigenium]